MKPVGVGDILLAFDRFGDRLYGEAVSQREHAEQAAFHATRDGAPDSLVLAALLHDYGHMLEGTADVAAPSTDGRHEAVGAGLLKGLFPPEVTWLIALHVAAKRYLCAIDPTYLASLSAASRHSLTLQGGACSAAEAERFVARPYAAQAVRLRRYDDAAKVVGASSPDLSSYAPLMARLAKGAVRSV